MIILESSQNEKRVKKLFREIGIERLIIEFVGKNEYMLKEAYNEFLQEIEKSHSEKEVEELKKCWNYKNYYSVAIELLIRTNAEEFARAIVLDDMNPTLACWAIFGSIKSLVENNDIKVLRVDLKRINKRLKEYIIL